MLYDPSLSGTSLSGASLAQRVRRMTPPQRAVLAAEILDGRVALQGLTAKSVAAMCGVNASYMFAALRCTPEQRASVAAGERPLIETRSRPALPAHWADADAAKIVEVIRSIGVDRALTAAIEVEAEHVGA
jgi:hypothetical protein